jgi:predicted SAM-dependent methyltransferase
VAASARPPVRLHLACGSTYKDGWVNVDLLGTRVDVALDLSRGLPWPDGAVDAVFHEHYLEHLSLSEACALTAEAHRVLRPGGVLRIGVPDAAACLRAYCGDAREAHWIEGRPAPLLAVSELVYEHGHRSLWDAQTLDLLCRAAGFPGADRREFGEGALQPNGDSEHRRGWTLYVEAVR